MSPDFTKHALCRRAFTLIELLVVVSIIALLIAILLPSLGVARRLAKTTVCGTNLHGIAESMLIYASDYNDSILGSPNTTGSMIMTYAPALISGYSNNNCPYLITADDWMTPVINLKSNNSAADMDGSFTGRNNRFLSALNNKSFICPANDFIATEYPSATVTSGTFRMPSYNTAACFNMNNAGYAMGSLTGMSLYNRGSQGVTTYDPSNGYTPKVSLVGSPSKKVFIADGARYVTTSAPPDVNLNAAYTSGAPAHVFESPGPCFTKDPGFCRDAAPGNAANGTATYDPRSWVFRHGAGTKFGGGDSFKGNLAFFDGHVETRNDLDASDPNLWMPQGAQWKTSAASSYFVIQPDVSKKYYNSSPPTIAVIN